MEGGVFQAIRTVASGRIRLALALLVLAPSVVAATAGSQIIRAQDMAPGTPAEGHVIASSRGGTSGALVRGIASADIAKLMPGTNQTASQSFSDFNDGRAVIIGHALADRLSLRAGGNITLVAPHGMTTAAGSGPPLMKTYTVAAVVPADSAPTTARSSSWRLPKFGATAIARL
jgi:hypothetical protein